MKRRRVTVQSSRTIYTYVYLYHGAHQAIEQAEASNEGSFYNCMSAIILCAFCIEAYLNHIGSETFVYWDSLERLKPREKLDVLKGHFGRLSCDVSRRPFQSFTIIFKFRNLIAHGKTEILSAEDIQELAEGERPKQSETEWEMLCTIVNAKRLLEDTKGMITEINKTLGRGDYPFGTFGHGSTSVGPA